MTLQILAVGATRIRKVGDEHLLCTPFMGAEVSESRKKLGIGLLDEFGNAIDFWGLMSPRNTVQFWRAMHVLNHVDRMGEDTLECSYYAATHIWPTLNHARLTAIEADVGLLKNHHIWSGELLKPLDIDKLESMLLALIEAGVRVSTLELKAEIEAGAIIPTKLITEIIEGKEISAEAYWQILREAAEPLEVGASLQAFLADIGVATVANEFREGDLVVLPDIELGDLDRHVRLRSLRGQGTLSLLCTHEDSSEVKTQASYAVPVAGDSRGTKYIFVEAFYAEGEIYVKAVILPSGGVPTTDSYTVADLREMVGKFPGLRARWRT